MARMKTIEIDGTKYMKKNGKLYTMPRIVNNRKILRNRLRTFLKSRGYKKVNKLMQQCWHDPDVRENL